MSMHLFIVDEKTFPIHLEYMFAGTGCQNYSINFNNPNSIKGNLVGMVADACRIRKGDKIIFYCTGKKKFYGVFKVKEKSFICNEIDKSVKLYKKIVCITRIEKYKVYSEGVTEWDMFECLDNIKTPQDIIWSLIYRKIDARRGNVPILPQYESKILNLFKIKNNFRTLGSSNFKFKNGKIFCNYKSDEIKNIFKNKKKINILPHINKREAFLQAYILQYLEKLYLNKLIFSKGSFDWIGNEIYCGFGEQKIDIMCIKKNFYFPIELKIKYIYPEIINQIERYILWIKSYCCNSSSTIQSF